MFINEYPLTDEGKLDKAIEFLIQLKSKVNLKNENENELKS